MAKILFIEASPRGEVSRSSKVANAFLEACQVEQPGATVEKWNVFDMDLPEFGREGASQKLAHIADLMSGGQGLTQAQGEWAHVVSLIEKFKGYDKYVISCPMWNFSIPYKLKQFFDIICQPALTFYVNGKGEYVGMLKGKPVQLILSRGSAYSHTFPREDDGTKSDFQTSYLTHVLKFIGFSDINTLLIEPTDAAPHKLDSVLEDCCEQAADHARRF